MQEVFSQPSQSLADQAYSIVEQMIISLELPPGSVFSEGQLSNEIGIGRTPLREALQKLAHGRLVAALPRRGMMVTQINVVEHLAMLETRRVLDRLLAESAARRRTEIHARRLRECASHMNESALQSDTAEFMRLDQKCDTILEDAARNAFAAQSAAPLHSHCRRFWSVHKHAGDLLESAGLHTALMIAVAEGDSALAGEASDALIDYLERFTKEALELA
jgi:DNA-binding GntR family transcriptional regulator